MINCLRYRYPIIRIGRVEIDIINNGLKLLEKAIQKYLCPNFKNPERDFSFVFNKIKFPKVTKVFDKLLVEELCE